MKESEVKLKEVLKLFPSGPDFNAVNVEKYDEKTLKTQLRGFEEMEMTLESSKEKIDEKLKETRKNQ